MTRYFHTTDVAAAAEIDSTGFWNGRGTYGLGIELFGVFVSDRPVGPNEGSKGMELFVVELPDDLDLADYELVEEGKPYREWIVPADVLNAGSVRYVGDYVAYQEEA
jgi:hypothetical protein